MRIIFQNPQSVINEAFALLAVFFMLAGCALIMLKPRFNRWIVLASTVVLWELCTLDLRINSTNAALTFAEFFIVIPWVMLCFRDSVLDRIICSALLMFTWFISEVMTELIFGRLIGIENYFESPFVCAAFAASALIIIGLITVLWIKLFRRNIPGESFTNIFAFITVVFAEIIIIGINCILLFGFDNKAAGNTGFNIILSLVLGFLFLDLMAFVYTRNTARLQKLNAENEILSAENRIQAEYYTKIRQSVDNAAKIRHDINNILNVIRILIKSKSDKDLQAASELMSELQQTADLSKIPSLCNNRLVNLILYDKLKTAEDFGVRITDNIILRDNCGIDDIDLCRVFVNLIDNGTNALKEITSDNKELRISCRESDGVIFIKTENEFELTTKKKKLKGHGYGLKIIKDICEKYNGNVTTDNDGQIFTVTVMIQSCGKADNKS